MTVTPAMNRKTIRSQLSVHYFTSFMVRASLGQISTQVSQDTHFSLSMTGFLIGSALLVDARFLHDDGLHRAVLVAPGAADALLVLQHREVLVQGALPGDDIFRLQLGGQHLDDVHLVAWHPRDTAA